MDDAICIIDLSGCFFRDYFATMSDVDAYALTVERCQFYRDEYRRCIVACDGPHNKRRAWYPEYKATRKEKPVEALDALRAIEQQVGDWGMPIIKLEGYEADDVIASVVSQAWLDDVKIVGVDKDLYQLLSDNVRIVTKRGEVGPAGCVDKFGVRPDQMIDWQTLCGDAVDNVPGCPGVGPGRARDLLQRFDTLDAVLAASDDDLRSVRGVGDKTVTALREWDPSLARRLVTLLTDAPVSIDELWTAVAV
jgi:DNA polymerase I